MRKASYLLVVLLLISSIPGRVFAAIPNPPTDFNASPTNQGTIQLKWQNNSGYDKQILKRLDRLPNLETLEPAPQGSQSSTDPNLNQAAVNGVTTYQYQLQTTKSGETQTNDASVIFLDSNIVTVTTQTAQAGTGAIKVIPRVGGVPVDASQVSPCAASVSPSFGAGDSCLKSSSNAAAGVYTVNWLSGYTSAPNVDKTKNPTITPSATQTLSSGGVITFYIDFASASYWLGCAPKSDSAITVSWSGGVPNEKTSQLYGSDSHIIPTVSPGSVLPAAVPGNFSYIDGSLAANTHRSYVIKTIDNSGATIWSNVADCGTGAPPVSDVPTNLDVVSVGKNILNFSWKDNATRPLHHFEVQRIRATPLPPNSDFKGTARSSNSISFSWSNSTGYVVYDPVLERSTSTNSTARFSTSDVSRKLSTLVSKEYDPYANGNTAGAINWPKSFTYDDSDVGEATTYYYRLKACFPDSVTKLYTLSQTANETKNPKPDMACSGYIPGGASVIATTTLPNAPYGLKATSTSPSSVAMTWKDASAKEQGFHVYRDGALIATVGASAGTGATISYSDSTGLNGGTDYAYTVKSFITDPLNGLELLSDSSNSSTATTMVTLTVSNSPTAGGSISGDVDCSSVCSRIMKVGDSVALTANPSTHYNFVNWTGNACNGSTNTSCSFVIKGDVSIAANFAEKAPQLETVTVNGFLNGAAKSTAFKFSLTDPTGATVVSGTSDTPIPFSVTADYPTDPSGNGAKFTFSYVSGGPAGAAFDKIIWKNSTGAQGQPSGKFTGQGFVGVQGGSLEYDVYFTGGSATDLSSPWYASIYGAAEDFASGLWNDLTLAFKSGWSAVAGLFNGVEMKKAEAVAGNIYDNYFGLNLNKFSVTLSDSHLTDANLVEGTVYIYRVRAVYDDGASPATSNWSVMAAGETLGNVVIPPNDGGAPVIYSGTTASGKVGQSFSYNISASNNPTSYGASGLPSGLGVDASTGVISGTPQSAGVSNAAITATNAKGTGGASLKITILTNVGSPGPGSPGPRNPGICIANNLCDKSIPNTQITDGAGLLLEQSEIQCVINADCVNVGRYSKTFQEK